MAAEWFCRIAGRELGPFSAQQLKQMAKEGRLLADDEVRAGSDGAWTHASHVKGLFPSAEAGGSRDESSSAPRPAPKLAASQPATSSKPPRAKRAPPVARPLDVPQAQAAAQPPAAQPVSPSAVPLAPARPAAAIPANAVPTATVPTVQPVVAAGAPVFAHAAARGGSPVGLSKSRKNQRVFIGGLVAAILILAIVGVVIVTNPDLLFSPAPSKGQFGRTHKKEEEPVLTTGVKPETSKDKTAEPAPKGQPTTTPAPSSTASDALDAATQKYQGSEIHLRIRTAGHGQPPFVRAPRNVDESEEFLLVLLQVENVTTTRKLDYKGFLSRNADLLKLTDNFGNTYRAKSFSHGMVEGQLATTSVRPGESVRDLLVFEAPIAKAESLVLDLPGVMFGGAGRIRFQMPKQMFSGQADLSDLPRPPKKSPEGPEPEKPKAKDPDEPPPLEKPEPDQSAGPATRPADPDSDAPKQPKPKEEEEDITKIVERDTAALGGGEKEPAKPAPHFEDQFRERFDPGSDKTAKRPRRSPRNAPSEPKAER